MADQPQNNDSLINTNAINNPPISNPQPDQNRRPSQQTNQSRSRSKSKSPPKKPRILDADPPIRRFNAHDYEKKIQEYLEKIDILEARIKLLGEQKSKVISKLQGVEEENKKLKNKLNSDDHSKGQISGDKASYERKIKDLETANRSLNDQMKDHEETINKELEDKENQMEKLKQELREKNRLLECSKVDTDLKEGLSNKIRDELTNQKELNKLQGEKISEMQTILDKFNLLKQNEATLIEEINHLKDDNLRLLQMLKTTEEFKDFAFIAETVDGGIRYIKDIPHMKGASSKVNIIVEKKGKTTISNSAKGVLDTANWLPSEAHTYAVNFRNKYSLSIDENILNELLAGLNSIWQEREKKQINLVKKEYQNEILCLRRKLSIKTGFKESQARTQINMLRKDLDQTRDLLRENAVVKNKMTQFPGGIDLVDSALKVASNFQNTKKCLENEIEKLKKQLADKDVHYSNKHQYYNQGCFWMSDRALKEIETFNKNVDEMFVEYESKVKNVDMITTGDEMVDYNIKLMGNSTRNFIATLKDLVKGTKDKFSEWKMDSQKHIDIIKANSMK